MARQRLYGKTDRYCPDSMAKRIIIVDDEPQVLKALERALMEEPYEIISFTSPKAAMESMAAHKYAVVISDQRMPEMLGTVFFQRVAEFWPETVRILLTGYTEFDAVVEAINKAGVYRFLTKPWNDNDLKLVIKNAILQYQINRRNQELVDLAQNTLGTMPQPGQEGQGHEKLLSTENYKLKKLRKRNLHQTVQSLVKLMDIFNPQLVEHGKAVANLSKYIGMDYSPAAVNVERLIIAALLHDIGFVGLPRNLSPHNDKCLNDLDQALSHQHSELGYLTLQNMNELQDVAMTVRAVHENYDGSGYPDRLSGDNIPLLARIIRVASDYESYICSEVSREKAVSLIALGRSQFYDPQVVSNFLSLMKTQNENLQDRNILIPLNPDQLEAGMVLAKNVYLKSGIMLLAKDVILDSKILVKLCHIDKLGELTVPIFAYRL